MNTKPEQKIKIDTAIGTVLALLSDGKQEWHHIRTNLEGLRANHETLTNRVLMIEDWSRKPFPKSIIQTYIDVTAKYFKGVCPCCGENQILNELGGRDSSLEVDHFKGPKWNKLHDGWPICSQCHHRLTHGYLNREGWVSQAFAAYQMRVNQYMKAQLEKTNCAFLNQLNCLNHSRGGQRYGRTNYKPTTRHWSRYLYNRTAAMGRSTPMPQILRR